MQALVDLTDKEALYAILNETGSGPGGLLLWGAGSMEGIGLKSSGCSPRCTLSSW
ncbi:MAG TPA: hypothetical protein VK901_03880 [Nitrospiraceae bacterium]|nr:hypothetical protein [Nitrospiraceae bacterium]